MGARTGNIRRGPLSGLTHRVAFVRELQGENPAYFEVISTPKHFAVHSGQELLRHSFDANVSEREYRALDEAVSIGMISEEEMDVSVKRLMTARFRLGCYSEIQHGFVVGPGDFELQAGASSSDIRLRTRITVR
jgi:hypothetical protein